MGNTTNHPTDVSNEEWAFVAPYLTLMAPNAPQRQHQLREVFNALRWIVRRSAMAPLADQLPPLGRGLSTDVALDCRWLLRGRGARSADAAALG